MNILMAEQQPYRSVFQVGGHHIASGLAQKNHTITYISTFLTPFHLIGLAGKGRRQLLVRFNNYIRGGQVENDKIYSYVPLSLLPMTRNLFLDNNWIADHFLKWTVPNLKQMLNRRGPYDAFLIGNPKFIPLISEIHASQRILRLVDNVTEFVNAPKILHRFLAEAVDKCDKIIVTSKVSERNIRALNFKRPLYYIPNGVNVGFFSKIESGAPEDLAAIKPPRVVYVGAIDDWFDVDLLFEIGKILSDVSFIIIGPPRISLKKLKKISNIHLIGPRPYNVVPKYLHFCDAGIIPFKKSSLVDGISPIKLYEYMACGLPVVATEWKELTAINSPALLVNTKDQFLQCLVEVLQSPKDSERFRSFAEQNSWVEKVNTIESIIMSG